MRESPTLVRTLAIYYVVGTDPPLVPQGPGGQPVATNQGGPARGTVFPMPDMHSVMRCSLVIIYLHLHLHHHCLGGVRATADADVSQPNTHHTT
jgi:hypothetical protein